MNENYDDFPSVCDRSGTGSNPEVPHGWHWAKRRRVNHVPRQAPHTSKASTAYWLQVGS